MGSRTALVEAQLLATGQTVKTYLTPNSEAHTSATFDLNDSTWVHFYYHDNLPLWTVLVSVASNKVVLSETITSSGVSLCKGLTVTMNPMGGTYTVLLDGIIIDNSTQYQFSGLSLGVFTRDMEMKRTVRSIMDARIRQFQGWKIGQPR